MTLHALTPFPGDALARRGVQDCEHCGGVVMPCESSSPPGLPPRDEQGCVQCWACALGEPDRRVDPRDFLGVATVQKRKAPRFKCRDCGETLPPERQRPGRCEKCRRKRRLKSWRNSKRRRK